MQPNAVLNAPNIEQTTRVFNFAFPGACAYSTGVTVFNPDGLAAGTGGIVDTGQNGFQPAFTVSQGGGHGRDATAGMPRR